MQHPQTRNYDDDDDDHDVFLRDGSVKKAPIALKPILACAGPHDDGGHKDGTEG